jgi:hypothetical protein
VDKRRAPRTRKRIVCSLEVGGSRHSGIVLDVSAGGLFVQTSASPAVDTPVRVLLDLTQPRETVALETRVARKRVVPPRLVAVAQGGLGLEIREAPDAFFRFVERLQPGERPIAERNPRAARGRARAAGRGAAPAPEARRFRVRMGQRRGNRSRYLTVAAPSAEEAQLRALAQIGDGWKVLGCEIA